MQPRVPLDMDQIKAFREKWKVKEFYLSGPVLREDLRMVLVTVECQMESTDRQPAGGSIDHQRSFPLAESGLIVRIPG